MKRPKRLTTKLLKGKQIEDQDCVTWIGREGMYEGKIGMTIGVKIDGLGWYYFDGLMVPLSKLEFRHD